MASALRAYTPPYVVEKILRVRAALERECLHRAEQSDRRESAMNGRPDEGRRAYRDTVNVVGGVALGLEDETLRETFRYLRQVQTTR